MSDELEEINIVLEKRSNLVAQFTVYPELDFAVTGIGIKGGIFSSSNVEVEVLPLSDLDVNLERLRELGENQ